MEFNHVKVEPNRINTTADTIESSVFVMSNAFMAIRDAIQSKLVPSWHGTPASNFFAKAEIDMQTFDSHIRALRNLTGKLKETSGIFSQSESNAFDQVRNLTLREGDV